MKRQYRYILLSLTLVLAAWLLFCTHEAGVISIREIVSRVSVPVITFALWSFVFASFGRRGRIAFFILLCLFTLFESVLGVLQLLKAFPSNNPYFILTGNFRNQGLYGGLMALTSVACLYEFTRARSRKLKTVIAVMFVVSFTMMAVSVSRAGWLGFSVATAAILYRETKFRINFGRKRNVIIAVAAVVVACVLVFVIKPESALARLHIWRMDCKAIVEQPLTGSGSAAEVGSIGHAQEHFYREKKRSMKVQQRADSPQFAYNEFLKFGIQGGVPAFVLSMAVFMLALLLLMKKRSELFYLLVAFGIFSLFSFPLSSITLCSILAVLLADASVSDGEEKLGRAIGAAIVAVCLSPLAVHNFNVYAAKKEWSMELSSTRRFGKYYPDLRYDPEFLHLYGLQLYSEGHYEHALKILNDGAEFNSGAVYFCLIGRCQEAVRDYKGALATFEGAMYMIPTRMTPYYMLVNFYKAVGMIPKAKLYRKKALALPYDKNQSRTVDMRQKIESVTFEDAD